MEALSLKETLDAAGAAWDELAGTTTPEADPVVEPVAEVAIVEPEEAPGEPHDGADTDGEEQADEPKEGDRARGADGKFLPKAAEAPAPVVAAASPLAPKTPLLPELKAPADWKPAAREKWATLPREVQEDAVRLHLETKKVLQDSAADRQTAQAFQRTVAPYEHMFRASGRSAIDGVGYLMQTYAALRTAPLPQRAQIVGNMIRDFVGTDDNAINLIASVLEGKAAPAGGSAPAAIRPEQIQQMVRQEAQRLQSEQGQQAEIKAINDFEASAPEFLGDVTQEMKMIVALEKQQGKPITTELLKQAYEKALRLSPQTASIMKQRDDVKAAQASNQIRTRTAAAAGIKSEPSGANGARRPKSTKDAAAEAYDELSSR